MRIRSIVFQSLIMGNLGTSILEQKYVETDIGLRELAEFSVKLRCQCSRSLSAAFRVHLRHSGKAWGYESLRDYLSKFFGYCRRDTRTDETDTKEASVQLIRKMMDYIHEHYGRRAGIDSNRKAADIGTGMSEMLNRRFRCRRSYLIKYRIMLGRQCC